MPDERREAAAAQLLGVQRRNWTFQSVARHTTAAALLALGMLAGVTAPGRAAAQTSVPGDVTTTPASSPVVGGGATPTSAGPDQGQDAPPAVGGDADGSTDPGDAPAADPAAAPGLDDQHRSLTAVAALPRAQDRLNIAQAELRDARGRLAAAEDVLTRAAADLESLSRRDRRLATRIAETEEATRRSAVSGYVLGPEGSVSGLVGGNDAGVRMAMVDAVTGASRARAGELVALRAAASRRALGVGRDYAAANLGAEAARAELSSAAQAADAAQLRVAVLAADTSSVLVFPVSGGRYAFSNDWGAPRSGGRHHEGTDVFAPLGTPLVAVESGVVTAAGLSGIGGQRVWLQGDSGCRYYYAHLQGYWPGIVVGTRVRAGEPLGSLGDTGNARGGPAHVHFEVHPPDTGEAVNPYPVLRASAVAAGAGGYGASTTVVGPADRAANVLAPWSDYALPSAAAGGQGADSAGIALLPRSPGRSR